MKKAIGSSGSKRRPRQWIAAIVEESFSNKKHAVDSASVTAPSETLEADPSHSSRSQALGGHQASHVKPWILGQDMNIGQSSQLSKPKTYSCSFCGQEFATGQSLGGHMGRHRAHLSETLAPSSTYKRVMKKVKTSRKNLCLDLNMPPAEEGV